MATTTTTSQPHGRELLRNPALTGHHADPEAAHLLVGHLELVCDPARLVPVIQRFLGEGSRPRAGGEVGRGA